MWALVGYIEAMDKGGVEPTMIAVLRGQNVESKLREVLLMR